MKEEKLKILWKKPLVSIIVITYNSSKFILETLESAKAQTYLNIELIISDDCSQDETIKICQNWLIENNERFVRTELITTLNNTGTAGNINRGINLARGNWIKLIAGDDALYPRLISLYIEYIRENKDIEFLHSKVVHYKESFDERNKLPVEDARRYKINQKGLTSKEQFEILLRSSLIGTPTIMIKTSVFKKVGLFDERFPLWEDRPMFLKIAGSNIKLEFLDVQGAKYRVRLDSVANSKSKKKLITNFRYTKQRGYSILFHDHLSGMEKILKKILSKIEIFFFKNLNKNSFPLNIFFKILVFPLRYIINKIDGKYK